MLFRSLYFRMEITIPFRPHDAYDTICRYPRICRVIDVAMVPVDPRLAEAGTWAAKYHLRHWDMRHMIPMHQWNEFDFTKKLLEEVPEAMDIVETVEENGQVFRF